MSESQKDTSKRIATLCKCRDFWPDGKEVRKCMSECDHYESRAGGWCKYYVGTSEKEQQMCWHEEKKSADKISALIQNWQRTSLDYFNGR